MAYTSIIPVSRLDNSITYIRNKDKTTKKGQSAGSLEEAIDYAMNRDKTERSIFEDAIGCVCETAYQDMVATKKRYHKMDGVQGFHYLPIIVTWKRNSRNAKRSWNGKRNCSMQHWISKRNLGKMLSSKV